MAWLAVSAIPIRFPTMTDDWPISSSATASSSSPLRLLTHHLGVGAKAGGNAGAGGQGGVQGGTGGVGGIIGDLTGGLTGGE